MRNEPVVDDDDAVRNRLIRSLYGLRMLHHEFGEFIQIGYAVFLQLINNLVLSHRFLQFSD